MPKYGLVNIRSAGEVVADEEKRFQEMQITEEVVETSLAAHIRKTWEINRQAKERIEDEMLDCLRQRKGEYDPRTLKEIRNMGGSEIYMKLTTTKIRAAAAWINEILRPTGDKAWGTDPTPIPELPGWAQQSIAQRLTDTMGEGETEEMTMDRASVMHQEVMKSMREIAMDASDRMEVKIEDQLVEGDWDKAVEEFIDDFCTFSASFMKGPFLTKKATLKWGEMDGSAKMKPVVDETVVQAFKRVSPFDMYPGPAATTIHDGSLIERERYSRKELYDLRGMRGYNDDAIDLALEEYGRSGLKDWLWRDYERAQLEGKENWFLRSDPSTIDAIHFYGSAQGLSLLEWGMSSKRIKDPLKDYEIDAILVGRHVIRAVINKDPLKRRPYKKASFQNVPGSFWGLSIPFLMRDIQRICNAAARALSNNLGIASGPQVEINVDRLPAGEPITQIFPWKQWQTTSDKTGSNQPALHFFQPQSNASELMTVFEFFEKKADDATNIPRYSYGSEKVGGAGRTASGLAMLMNSAAKGIKAAISNIDIGVIKQVIEEMYTFNMMRDPDPLIKGDLKVVARGASAILVKEQAQLRRNEFLAFTNNEIDLGIIGPERRAEILREVAKELDMPIDRVMPSRQEILERKIEESQQEPPPPPELLKIESQAKSEAAKLDQAHQHFMEELDFKASQFKEQGIANIQMNEDRLDMEESIRRYQTDAETTKAEKKAELEEEKMRLAHKRDLEKIRKELQLAREKKNSEAGEKGQESGKKEIQAAGIPDINITIDTSKGTVKKHIAVNRDKTGKIASGDVTEEEA